MPELVRVPVMFTVLTEEESSNVATSPSLKFAGVPLRVQLIVVLSHALEAAPVQRSLPSAFSTLIWMDPGVVLGSTIAKVNKAFNDVTCNWLVALEGNVVPV